MNVRRGSSLVQVAFDFADKENGSRVEVEDQCRIRRARGLNWGVEVVDAGNGRCRCVVGSSKQNERESQHRERATDPGSSLAYRASG